MPEEVKFNEEELKTLREIQKKYFDIQNNFGRSKIARINMSRQLDDIDKYEVELQDNFLESNKF